MEWHKTIWRTFFSKQIENDTINNRLIKIYDDSINTMKDNYNNLTREFNVYYSIFPNFIIAKRNHYKRKKFLTLIYGKYNEDPIIKNKEIPKWMKEMEEKQIDKK